MLLRIFVYIYFPLISLGNYLAEKYNFQFAKGIVFSFAFFYILYRIVVGLDGKIQRYNVKFNFNVFILYSYVILYSVLYFTRRSSSITGAIVTTPILLVHTLFWDFLFSSKNYEKDLSKFFFDLFISFLIGMLFFFVSSLFFTHFSFEPGSIHDIAENYAMISSDLDVPFLLLIIFTFIISQTKIEKYIYAKKISKIVIAFIIVFSFFVLWLYARRGPMFVLAALLPFIFISYKKRNKIFILFAFFPAIPMFWDIISNFLLDITQTSFVSSILARNNINDYLTATNRTIDWMRGISFLLDFKFKHLIGYGGPPWFVVTAGRDHMHNVILTMIFDSGIIVFLLFVSLYIVLIKKTYRISEEIKDKIWGVEALPLILFIYLFFSPIEPLLHAYSNEHLIFLVIAITILRLDEYVRFSSTK